MQKTPSPLRPGRSSSRVVAGVVIWVCVIAGATALARARGAELKAPASRLARFATHLPTRVEVELVGLPDPASADGWAHLQPGDPVLSRWDRTYVGSVVSVTEHVAPVGTPTITALIALDPELDTAGLENAPYSFETSAGDPSWVLQTLFPESKREIIRTELQAYVDSHKEEIAAFVRPIGEDVLEHTMGVLENNLGPVLKAHEKEIQALLDKHREGLKDSLLPVLKEQLGPSVKARAKPILTRIGRELWDALPLGEMSWNWAKARLPYQQNDVMDAWWQNFLETKALPIVKEHEAELVKAGEELVQEGIRDPKVRAAFAEAAKRLAKDPEFKRVVRMIIEEALVRPFDPSALARRILGDPGHRARFLELEHSFTPTLRKLTRLVSMDEKTNGLSPDLARVLRRIVFGKDQRWVAVAVPGAIRRLSEDPDAANVTSRTTGRAF